MSNIRPGIKFIVFHYRLNSTAKYGSSYGVKFKFFYSEYFLFSEAFST